MKKLSNAQLFVLQKLHKQGALNRLSLRCMGTREKTIEVLVAEHLIKRITAGRVTLTPEGRQLALDHSPATTAALVEKWARRAFDECTTVHAMVHRSDQVWHQFMSDCAMVPVDHVTAIGFIVDRLSQILRHQQEGI